MFPALGLPLILGLSISCSDPQNEVIFYLLEKNSHYELRVYHPAKGNKTVLRVSGKPRDLYWTKDFKRLAFRIADTVFESDWRIGADKRKSVTLSADSLSKPGPLPPEVDHNER